jgi:hypothetical protein
MLEPQPQKNEAIKIALIGALATLGAAVIAGVFGLLQSRPAQTEGETRQMPATAAALPTARFVVPMLFASKIAPDGEAIDPADTFSTTVTDLYVVFPESAMPAGLTPHTENPVAGAYYAHFKRNGVSPINTFGWRWLKDGKQLVEFFADPTAPPFFLKRFDYNGKGIFGEWGAGDYTVVILVNGTPMYSGHLHITESSS